MLFVTPFGRRLGGSDNVLLWFLQGHERERLDVAVAFLEPGPFADEVRELGLRAYRLPGGRLRDPAHVTAHAARLARVIRREDPGLVVNWLSTAQVYGGLAAILARGRRTIWWQHDLNVRGLRGKLLDRAATALPAVAIGACSQVVAEHQSRIRPRRRTFAVLPGIPSPAPPVGSAADVRDRLEIPPEAFVVGCVGRIQPWKRQDRVLKVVAALNREGVAAHALLVGGPGHRQDAAYEGRLRRLEESPELAGRVVRTGQVDDVGEHLAAIDVVVSASEPEPFGLVVLEAMAAGLPVVAMDAGGPREIVDDGRTGFLVRGDEELVAALARLAGDAALRGRLGAAARERVLRSFTAERMVGEMTDRIEELVR